jgi:hypothetical protein
MTARFKGGLRCPSQKGKIMKKTNIVETELLHIDEQMCKDFLAVTAPNRPLSEATVAERMRTFLDRKWKFNGAPIRFNTNGQLIDGRHRLTGYLAARQADPSLPPFLSLVVYGIDEDAMATIDTGRVRSVRDHLNINGQISTHVLGAVLRKLAYFAYDQTDKVKLTIDETMNILDLHPKVVNSVKRCCPIEIVPKSTLGAIHYIAGYFQGDLEAANDFLNVFRTGKPGYEGCPAHRVREHFIRLRSDKKMMIDQEKAKILVWAWNCFRENKSVYQIRVPDEIRLEGWTPDICFGEDNILAKQANETNKIARKVTYDIMGKKRSGSSFSRERKIISKEIDEEDNSIASLVRKEGR